MNTHDFALWLHGFTELTNGAMPTEAQWKMIVEHLDLCFNKVTKPLDAEPAKEQEAPAPKKQAIRTPSDIRGELERAAKDFAEREKAQKAEIAQRQAEQRKQWEDLIKNTPRAVPGTPDDYYKDRTRILPLPSYPPFPGSPAIPTYPSPYMPQSPNPLDGRYVLTC